MDEKKADTLGTPYGLVRSLPADLTAAAIASALVSPIVSVIDSAIITKTATSAPLRTCISTALRKAGSTPSSFFRSKPLLLMLIVYFGTYTTANTADSLHASLNSLPQSTTAASMGLCVYKDGRFAKILGAAAKARVPETSYGLFLLRDGITVWALLILPTLLAPWLASLPYAKSGHFSRFLGSEGASLRNSQLMLPAAIQFIMTPIHLLGLSYHNHQGRSGFAGDANLERGH